MQENNTGLLYATKMSMVIFVETSRRIEDICIEINKLFLHVLVFAYPAMERRIQDYPLMGRRIQGNSARDMHSWVVFDCLPCMEAVACLQKGALVLVVQNPWSVGNSDRMVGIVRTDTDHCYIDLVLVTFCLALK